MCIIQGETHFIGDTQIFCFIDRNNKYQITVYTNEVKKTTDYDKNTAMILPIPKGYEAFHMIDLSDDHDLFKKLNDCFPAEMPLMNSSPNVLTARGIDFLPVKKCGSYEYSLVPYLSDFTKINPEVFKLDKTVESLLQEQYATGYSFLVCKIHNSMKFHPVAYMHPIQNDSKLFIPTLHFHQGHDNYDRPDWDHEIYLITNKTIGKKAQDIHGIKHIKALNTFLPDISASQLKKMELKGSFMPNIDLLIPVK